VHSGDLATWRIRPRCLPAGCAWAPRRGGACQPPPFFFFPPEGEKQRVHRYAGSVDQSRIVRRSRGGGCISGRGQLRDAHCTASSRACHRAAQIAIGRRRATTPSSGATSVRTLTASRTDDPVGRLLPLFADRNRPTLPLRQTCHHEPLGFVVASVRGPGGSGFSPVICPTLASTARRHEVRVVRFRAMIGIGRARRGYQ